MTDFSENEIRLAWHDAVCPESAKCPSRSLHALNNSMTPVLYTFLEKLPQPTDVVVKHGPLLHEITQTVVNFSGPLGAHYLDVAEACARAVIALFEARATMELSTANVTQLWEDVVGDSGSPPSDPELVEFAKAILRRNWEPGIESIQGLLDQWVALFKSLTSGSPQAKLPEETREFLDAEDGTAHKLEEAADVIIVTMTELAFEGFTLAELADAIQAKLLTNLSRQWALHDDGTVSHVKPLPEDD